MNFIFVDAGVSVALSPPIGFGSLFFIGWTLIGFERCTRKIGLVGRRDRFNQHIHYLANRWKLWCGSLIQELPGFVIPLWTERIRQLRLPFLFQYSLILPQYSPGLFVFIVHAGTILRFWAVVHYVSQCLHLRQCFSTGRYSFILAQLISAMWRESPSACYASLTLIDIWWGVIGS